MYLGTPRMLLYAAGLHRNPEVDHQDPTQQLDPVERTVIVDEPAVPDHVGELVGVPALPQPEGEATDELSVPDDLSALFDDLGTEHFPM